MGVRFCRVRVMFKDCWRDKGEYMKMADGVKRQPEAGQASNSVRRVCVQVGEFGVEEEKGFEVGDGRAGRDWRRSKLTPPSLFFSALE